MMDTLGIPAQEIVGWLIVLLALTVLAVDLVIAHDMGRHYIEGVVHHFAGWARK